jgi:two-component system, response regulator
MSESAPVEILLVEDDPHDLELTLRAFRKARIGNNIQVARDGVEAMEYLFGEGEHEGRNVEQTPRVVLLDLKLPRVDGLEVLRRVKGDARTRHVPIVVLTSSREQRDVIESYQLGVNSYIVKPVSFDRFAAAVQELGLYWLVMNQVPEGGSP